MFRITLVPRFIENVKYRDYITSMYGDDFVNNSLADIDFENGLKSHFGFINELYKNLADINNYQSARAYLEDCASCIEAIDSAVNQFHERFVKEDFGPCWMRPWFTCAINFEKGNSVSATLLPLGDFSDRAIAQVRQAMNQWSNYIDHDPDMKEEVYRDGATLFLIFIDVGFLDIPVMEGTIDTNKI